MVGVRVLAGVTALAAATAVWFVGSTPRPPPVAQRDLAPAPVSEQADDPLDISANTTPSLARSPVDPSSIVLAHRVDQPTFSCGFHVSSDGGVSWQESAIPEPPGTEPKCYAPDVAFGADGTLYVSFLMLAGLGNVPDSLWIASSDDGGRTLSTPVRVAGPLAFQPRLAAHPSRPDVLALTWLQASDTGNLAFPDTGYPIVMARSDDGGQSWADPVQVSDPRRERVLAASPALTDTHTFVVYLDVLDDRLDYHGAHGGQGGPAYPGPWELVLARSPVDEGTWTETTIDTNLTPIDRYLVFLPPFPSLAVHAGRVSVAFHDARAGDADVWMWTSDEAGERFAPEVRVNDNPPGDGTSQHLPQVAAAPDGRLDVVYLDRRADPNDVLAEVVLQSSADGGQTFGPRVMLSDAAFDSRVGWGSHRGLPELGSRLGLLSTSTQALAAWPDGRAGTVELPEQDIYRALASFPPSDGGTRPALKLVAGMLALIGAVLLACGARRARRAGRAPGDVPGGS